MIHERGPGVPEPGGHDEHVVGQAGGAEAVGDEHRRERRDLGGLEDHGVARHEGRDGIADAEHERVVPGRDHADDAQWLTADDHLAPEREGRARGDLLVAQVALGVALPVLHGVGQREDLVVDGVLVCLAGLAHRALDDGRPVVDRATGASHP